LQSVVQNTSERPDETLEIHVYKGLQSEPYYWYEDDGSTYEFETGSFYQREIALDLPGKTLRLTKAEGSFHSKFAKIRFVMHGFGTEIVGLTVDKKQIGFENSTNFIDILNETKKLDNLKIFTIENTENQININW
jgi:alpha-glucosidase